MKLFFFEILSQIYRIFVFFRNFLYTNNYLTQVKLAVPVVSVGNLTLGGTGKTPITDYILKLLEDSGQQVVLVSRAYKAAAVRPVQVDLLVPEAAKIYGDEAVMLAEHNPTVRVFVGRNKAEIAQAALKKIQAGVVVVDDGFQHRRLHRDLDIVLLDVTESLENYALLPRGRARESINSLSRADLLILTKTNLVDEERLVDLQKIIPIEKPCACVSFHIGELLPFFGSVAPGLPASLFVPEPEDSVVLFSGIARPEIFLKMFRQKYPKYQLHLIPFPDHHQYTGKDIQLIRKRVLNCRWFVTTEKDAVKVKALWDSEAPGGQAGTPLWVASLSVKFESGDDVLRRQLSQLLSGGDKTSPARSDGNRGLNEKLGKKSC